MIESNQLRAVGKTHVGLGSGRDIFMMLHMKLISRRQECTND